MKSRLMVAAPVAVLLMLGASTSYGASLNTKLEVKCFGALTKGASKHQAAVAKAMAKCRSAVIAGDPVGPCPDATADTAIEKSLASVAKSVAKKCKSTCSVSGVDCIDNLFCPPNGNLPENCTAGAKGLPFSATNMGYPGAYCEAVLGHQLSDGTGFGECMAGLGALSAGKLMDYVYGDLDQTSGVSDDGAKCLSAIIKALPKAAGKMAKAVSKCRETQLGADPATIQPDDCATDDLKASEAVGKARTSALDAIAKSCTDATIQELDLCGQGQGGVTSLADAKTCLGDVLDEASISIEFPEDRNFMPISLINAAYPTTSSPRCGDDLVNQIPSQFFRMGEECDGEDDDACPGACIPPGDASFQCTCSTTPRIQSYAVGATADLDNGWSGASHNSAVTQGAGYITDATNCNCSAFDPVDKATCTGTTTDPVCDSFGAMGPRCTFAPYDGITCDQHGNNNGIQTDNDCQVCDTNSINAGTWCDDETDCLSQCFSPEGVVTGPCEKQSECTGDDICRGRCDKETAHCTILRNGAPLPLSSQGTSVCVDVQYFTDVTGTRNIVTGEHEANFDLRSKTFLAQNVARPCPVCGGFCTAPGVKVGDVCEGTCSGPFTRCRGGTNKDAACTDDSECPASACLGVACRFDSDCTDDPGATCGAASPECLGEDCQLALLCAGGDNDGRSCRIEATTAFGTTSVDCPPTLAGNISGAGLAISYTPLTSETVTLENPGTCDAPGYQNLNGCFCVLGGGSVRNTPNRCDPACTAAGPTWGRGCGGNFTTCVGGFEAGVACDEDNDCRGVCVGGTEAGSQCNVNSDCAGIGATCSPIGVGTCTGNPKICDGGANAGNACTSDAGCPGSTCVDACPGGICTPLCTEKGVCSGGANDGLGCGVGVTVACPGGTCVVVDDEEGVCAAGPPLYNCGGRGHEFRVCLPADEGTTNGCEAGTDNILGNEDDFTGAGTCVATVRGCFVNNGLAEGGDTLNGEGGATNTKSVTVFCIPASSSSSVNATAGLPGPARLREHALLVPNFTVLPVVP